MKHFCMATLFTSKIKSEAKVFFFNIQNNYKYFIKKMKFSVKQNSAQHICVYIGVTSA